MRFQTWSVIFLTVISCTTFAEVPNKDAALRKEYIDFLERLGFEDYSTEIRNNIAREKAKNRTPGVGVASEDVLKSSAKTSDILNTARELGVEVATALELSPNDAALQARAITLTQRMLSLKPLEIPACLPIPVVSRTDQIRFNEFLARTKMNVEKQTQQVAADILETLMGSKEIQEATAELNAGKITEKTTKLINTINKASELARKLVSFMYQDSEVGQTRYGGRALAAALTKFSRKSAPQMEQNLKLAVANENDRLENYIGNTLHVPSTDGQARRIPLQSGDFIMERSRGLEAAAIGIGVIPGKANRDRAIELNLQGHVSDVAFPEFSTEGERRNRWNRFVEDMSHRSGANQGFSHVGRVELRQDPETGIQMAWGQDVYTDDKNGKVRPRIGILESFAPAGPFMRFGVARYSPEKFWNWAQEQIAKNGYQEDIISRKIEVLNDKGEAVIPPDAQTKMWRTTISKADFEALHKKPEGFDRMTEAEKQAFYKTWYEKITELSLKELRKIYTEEGLGFSYSPADDKAFCSELQWLITRRATGLDLQKTRDEWHRLSRGLYRLGVPNVQALPINARIVAPSGFAWQKDLTSMVEVVDLPIPRMPRPSAVLTQREIAPLSIAAHGAVQKLAPYEEAHPHTVQFFQEFEKILKDQTPEDASEGPASSGISEAGYILSHKCPEEAKPHRIEKIEASIGNAIEPAIQGTHSTAVNTTKAIQNAASRTAEGVRNLFTRREGAR